MNGDIGLNRRATIEEITKAVEDAKYFGDSNTFNRISELAAELRSFNIPPEIVKSVLIRMWDAVAIEYPERF